MINGRGLIYTVEEVSELLGIPRPTLYRYLREYSIPHLRKSGKISIPEESFDRIREARDLHKEGLGTESVRRVLREGNTDTGEIKERIERLSESLEKLKGNGSAADEALSSQAMRTMLARQSLIMSAMFNLTEMVEELLLASGRARPSSRRSTARSGRCAPRPDRAPADPEDRAGRRYAQGPPRSSEPLHARREVRLPGAAETPNLAGAPGGAAGLRSAGAGAPVGEPFAGLPLLGDRASESRPTPRTRGRRTKRRRIRRRGTWRRRGLLQRTARPRVPPRIPGSRARQ